MNKRSLSSLLQGNWVILAASGLLALTVAVTAFGQGRTQTPPVKIESAIPAGTILAFGGEEVPDGFYPCDGTPRTIAGNESLYKAIGFAWGYTPDKKSFLLPNLQGVFLRGVDYNRGLDSDKSKRYSNPDTANAGGKVGSFQDSAFKKHSHFIKYPADQGGYTPMFASKGERSVTETPPSIRTADEGEKDETRPVNVYVNYIIKH